MFLHKTAVSFKLARIEKPESKNWKTLNKKAIPSPFPAVCLLTETTKPDRMTVEEVWLRAWNSRSHAGPNSIGWGKSPRDK